MKRWITLCSAVLAVGSLALAACTGGDDDDSTPVPTATPTVTVSSTRSTDVPAGVEPLTVARLDLAARIGVEPLDVQVTQVRAAGWDGCLGVAKPGEACTEIFIQGLIAWFRAEGHEELFRYHLGGTRVIATDFAEGEVSNGIGPPGAILMDIHARLAAYAKDDLSLRLTDDGQIEFRVDAILPTLFNNGCIGFAYSDDRGCDGAITPGAIVVIEAVEPGGGTDQYLYHVARSTFVAVAFEDGAATVTATPKDSVVWQTQLRMQEDLAERLGITTAPSMVSFREVTWSSGCLGVQRVDRVCTQALVEGFFAELTDGIDVYRYHGADRDFIAASFEDGATISDPLPREN